MWLLLMSVWEGGEADLCPGFLFFLFFFLRSTVLPGSSAGLRSGAWEESWRRDSRGQSDLFCGGEHTRAP